MRKEVGDGYGDVVGRTGMLCETSLVWQVVGPRLLPPAFPFFSQ